MSDSPERGEARESDCGQTDQVSGRTRMLKKKLVRQHGPVTEHLAKLGDEMDVLVLKGQASKESATRFRKDMEGFLEILLAYEEGLERGTQHVDWSKVSTERIGDIITPYEECPDESTAAVGKLAIVKLNGGLGTTMGCTGPKSVIEVRNGKTFLDLIVDQVHELKESTGHSVPLVLMNSFNTHEETGHVVKRYEQLVDIYSFEQSQHPRFTPGDHMPVVSSMTKANIDAKHLWYPPGHGDVFEALCNSGTLAQLEARGVEYAFISNVDNLGATADFRILNKMIESGAEFVMEVTAKTDADVKVRHLTFFVWFLCF